MTGAELPLLHGPDGLLLPGEVVLGRLRPTLRQLVLTALPLGNRGLPDLLALAGIAELVVDGAPRGRWQGPGGGSVLLNGGSASLLMGELAAAAPAPCDGAGGAADHPDASERLSTAGTYWFPQAAPDPAAAAPAAVIGNPLCRRRRALATLAALAATETTLAASTASADSGASSEDARMPAALEDAAGGRHPVQVAVDGLLVSLPLDGLASTPVHPHPGAVAGSHWEVDALVLDNGRIRAELDHQGQLVRLCGDSQFAPFGAPALRVLAAGGSLGPAHVSVRERGPVRATLVLERPELSLSLSLEAHGGVLVVEAHARVPGLWLELPLPLPTPPLIQDGGPLRSWVEEDALAVRGLACVDQLGQGLVLGSRCGLALRRQGHGQGQGLAIAVASSLRIALAPHGRLERGPTPWEAADALVAHAAGRWPALAPTPLHLGLPPSVDAAWLPPAAGMRASVLLREMLGGHARLSARWRAGGEARWLLSDAAGRVKRGRGEVLITGLEPHALARLDVAAEALIGRE